jgi:beta-lactamase family protein
MTNCNLILVRRSATPLREDMKSIAKGLGRVIVFAICLATAGAADDAPDRIESVVGAGIQPVMAKYGIAGVAVGITVAGKSSVYNYGVASTETRQPVTRDTLFEIGSITKTFTATLASYAQVRGYLSLSDKTSKYLSSLQDSKFGKITLLNLGTHTPVAFLYRCRIRSETTINCCSISETGSPPTNQEHIEPIPIPVSAHSG